MILSILSLELFQVPHGIDSIRVLYHRPGEIGSSHSSIHSVQVHQVTLIVINLSRLLIILVHYMILCSFRLRGKSGEVVDFILKVLQCCLWCFEKFLAYLNRNAYIEIGKPLVNFPVLDFDFNISFLQPLYIICGFQRRRQSQKSNSPYIFGASESLFSSVIISHVS